MTSRHSDTSPSVLALKKAFKSKSRRRRETFATYSQASNLPRDLRNDLLPQLELVERAPHTLIAPSRNVRVADKVHIEEVMAAIGHLGFCDPVLIDERNNVLDGVVRVAAAQALELSFVPCILAKHLTAAERRLLRVAVNRLGEKGSWNIDELKLELQDLIIEDAPIEISGFTTTEIDQIMIDSDIEAGEAGPIAPEAGAPAIARLGDIFVLGNHRVVCGDATDPRVFKILMGSDQARAALTDVPYNVPIAGNVTKGDHREFAMASGEMSDAAFKSFNVGWIALATHHLCDGGLFGTFIDWRGYPIVHVAALQVGLIQLNLIVWSKNNAGMGSLYRSQHELLPLFKKGRAPHVNNVALGKHGRWRSNVWTYPGASSFGSDARKGLQQHPTVKPVAMLEDALLDLTEAGDIVLDPFLGSGSMLIAAEKARRRCRGIEIDPLYVDVILRRYAAATGVHPVLESSGETIVELAERRKKALGQ